MGKMCPEEDMKQALEEVEDRSVSSSKKIWHD